MAEFKWTASQELAINAPTDNILVSAAAGSGKTAVLVERIIRMLSREENPLDIDRLVVITFTRAAAASMKNKIYKRLREVSKEHPENVYLRQQLMKVQHARICTIDSLCADIVRNNIQDIDLDPGFRLAEEAEIRLLKKDVLGEVLEAEYARASEGFLQFAGYYVDKNDKKLEDIILKLHAYSESHPAPEAWLDASADIYADAGNMFADEKYLEDDNESDWMSDYKNIVINALENVQTMALQGRKIARRNYGPFKHEQLFQDILSAVTEILKSELPLDSIKNKIEAIIDNFQKAPRYGKNDEVDEDLKNYAKSLLSDGIKKQLNSLHDDFLYADYESMCRELAACEPVAKAIVSTTKRFAASLKQAKMERQIADFSDIAHYALKVLLRYDEDGRIIRDANGHIAYTDTADIMSRSIDEIIVDEYQDTNELQEYLVGALSSERFGRPNVFMVGDVKQSIYGFRMACPELFTNKYDNYRKLNDIADYIPYNAVADKKSPHGWLIKLDMNFRSRREVVDITNYVFRQSMIREVGGIDYPEGHELVFGKSIEQDEEKLSDHTPEIFFINGKGDGKQAKYQEGYEIAKRIEQLTAEGKYSLSDIAILTRNSDNPELEQVLTERGIAVIKSSGKGYFECFEIRLILNLLNIVDNPYQDIPFTAVLYSPICSASADELARIRLAGGKQKSIYECLLDYCEQSDGKFTWFVQKLDKWRSMSQYMSVCDFIEYVMKDSGLQNILSAMPQGMDRIANIGLLKSKAHTFARGSYTGLFNFLRYMHEIQKNDIDFGKVNAASGSVKAVTIMTIHKSKGLEFPVVFLANCGKSYNKTDVNSSNIIPDRRLGIGIEYRDVKARLNQKTVLMQTIRRLQKTSLYAEELRLLYVAMTRAVDMLIISGATQGNESLDSSIKKWDEEKHFAEDRLKAYKVMDCSSYMKVLGLTLHKNRENNTLYNLNYLLEYETEEKRASELIENQITEGKVYEIARRETDISGIERQCNYKYPFDKAAHIQGKISASQLENKDFENRSMTVTAPCGGIKKAENGTDGEGILCRDTYTDAEVDDRGTEFDETENVVRRTERRNHGQKGKAALTGTDRGNAYHRFFELLDYNKDIRQQLDEYAAAGRISAEYAGAIEISRMETFINSDIGQRMKQAFNKGKLFRERQFVKGSYADIAKIKTRTGMSFSSSQSDVELLLVQGIIDAYFFETSEDGVENIILVDYKTDKSRDEGHYTGRYMSQLNEYADALEKTQGRKVTEKIIYSIELGKAIHCD